MSDETLTRDERLEQVIRTALTMADAALSVVPEDTSSERTNWEWNQKYHAAMDLLAAKAGIRPAKIRPPGYIPCRFEDRMITDPMKNRNV